MIVLGKLDDAARARLDAAVARVRPVSSGYGPGEIWMMAGADRMRRLRARRRRDVVQLMIEVPHFDLIDGLIRKGELTEVTSRDKTQTNAAAARALMKYLKK